MLRFRILFLKTPLLRRATLPYYYYFKHVKFDLRDNISDEMQRSCQAAQYFGKADNLYSSGGHVFLVEP